MKKFVVTAIIVFLLMMSFVAGAEIDFYKRETLIQRKGTEITDTILFNQMPRNFELPFLFSIDDFSLTATFKNYDCRDKKTQYGTLIQCSLPGNQSGRLTLNFETTDLTKKINSHYYFEDSLKVPRKTEKLVYSVKLESGLVLIPENSTSPFPRYSPTTGEKGSDGRRIFVYWTQKNVGKGEGIAPSVSYESVEKPTRKSIDVYTFIAGAILLVVLLVLGFSLSSGRERSPALKDDERQVMDLIQGAGGEIKQKRIVNRTEFSKAKVSRLVKDLEERGLLEKEKVGRTNRIRLSEGEENE